MTVKITLTKCRCTAGWTAPECWPTLVGGPPIHKMRKLMQNFAGCTDVEHGKAKAGKLFPGCKITKAEELVEKKK